jgi:DNA-binding beta-propeller fold protein YncE
LNQTFPAARAATPDQLNPRTTQAKGSWRAWVLLRVPVLLVLVFLFKGLILSIDPAGITLFVIGLASTPFAHALVFLVGAAVLAIAFLAARRFGTIYGYLAAVILAVVLSLVAFHLVGTQRRMAVLVVALVATNLMPDAFFDRVFATRRLRDGFMTVGVGVAELFFFRRYLAWVFQARPGGWISQANSFMAMVPAIIFAAAAGSICIGATPLTGVEQAVRMPPTAQILARGDFNGIELDSTGRYLFVTGHGVPRLQRLDVANPAHDVLETSVDTGVAQGFAYDPVAGELYVFNTDTLQLLYFDAATLKEKRAIAIPDLSPGDPWIAFDPRTNTLTIASEADTETGTPFLVLNRSTGAVLDRRNLEAGNLLLRPDESRLYLSFFRRSHRLMAYDLRTLSIAEDRTVPPHVDRIAYLPSTNEILLASPAQSRILRYDAATLASKGYFDSIFGVRVLAIDPARHILFAGSLATGEVSATNLTTGRQMGRFYLGPWLRTIELDPARATAYISANGALYELRYGQLH